MKLNFLPGSQTRAVGSSTVSSHTTAGRHERSLVLADRHDTSEKREWEHYNDCFKLSLLHPTPLSPNDEAEHGLLTENQYEVNPLPELWCISLRLHLTFQPDPKHLHCVPINPKRHRPSQIIN
jgi:hypothetical protein